MIINAGLVIICIIVCIFIFILAITSSWAANAAHRGNSKSSGFFTFGAILAWIALGLLLILLFSSIYTHHFDQPDSLNNQFGTSGFLLLIVISLILVLIGTSVVIYATGISKELTGNISDARTVGIWGSIFGVLAIGLLLVFFILDYRHHRKYKNY